MTDWKPIETAPRDRPFLALQEGEVYVARFTREENPRLTFRTHDLDIKRQYRLIQTDLEGEIVEAHVPINEPWPEVFRHSWALWTRGFEFAPTHWARLELPDTEHTSGYLNRPIRNLCRGCRNAPARERHELCETCALRDYEDVMEGLK